MRTLSSILSEGRTEGTLLKGREAEGLRPLMKNLQMTLQIACAQNHATIPYITIHHTISMIMTMTMTIETDMFLQSGRFLLFFFHLQAH